MTSRAELYARLPVLDTDRWWLDLARASPDGRVVELGAGAGRLTAALADAGAVVTAVEHDPAMLERLRRVAADVKVAAGEVEVAAGDVEAAAGDVEGVAADVEVVAADVADLPALAPAGLVVLASSLLNELPDRAAREAALAGAARNCRADGTVALHLLGPWWLVRLDGRSAGRLQPADGGPPIEVVVDAGAFDAARGRRQATLTYRFPDGTVLDDHLDAAVVTPTELDLELAAAGLEVVEQRGVVPTGPGARSAPALDAPGLHLRCRPVSR